MITGIVFNFEQTKSIGELAYHNPKRTLGSFGQCLEWLGDLPDPNAARHVISTGGAHPWVCWFSVEEPITEEDKQLAIELVRLRWYAEGRG